MRMVVSVYMGDFEDEELLDVVTSDWQDPPYPRPWNLREALKKRVHWRADDPSIHCGMEQVKF
jgi:hypothetical protein